MYQPMQSMQSMQPGNGYGSGKQFGGDFGAMQDDSNLGNAYGYGAVKGRPRPPMHHGRHVSMNVVAICLALFVPWLIFCFTMASKAFWLHYMHPAAANGVVAALFLVVAVLFVKAFTHLKASYLDDGPGSEPSWYTFIFIAALIGWILGLVLGNNIFFSYMQQYYDIDNLNVYTGVDPVLMRGQQIMDAGRIEFVPDASLVMNKAKGFKNDKTYCVVPITSGAAAGNAPLANYDFWAVGTDCCSDTSADFRCGDYDRPHVNQGLRIMEDDNRNFYRLAVQEASSAYGINAIHPIFVEWTSDATAAMTHNRQLAARRYMIFMFAFFGGNLLAVYMAAKAFSQK